MPPKRATRTDQLRLAQLDVAVAAAKDPATFDVAGWLRDLAAQGFKPRNVTVPMHLRGDLLPRINDLVTQIQGLQDGPDVEHGVDDAGDQLGVLTAEYERLVDEFHEGGSIEFVFRPINKRIQNSTFEAFSVKYPDEDARKSNADELVLTRMAASCVSFPGSERFGEVIPPEAFDAFEDTFGAAAFNTLIAGFVKTYEAGGELGAPFLPKPSPDLVTGG